MSQRAEDYARGTRPGAIMACVGIGSRLHESPGESDLSRAMEYEFNVGRSRAAAGGLGAGPGGGDMDDVLRRLGVIEKDVSDIKADVAAIAVQLPQMATKTEVAAIAAQLPHMATKADVGDAKVSIIQWMVGTTIAVASLAFVIAKFVH
jgi:hypothetical protein